VITNAVVFTVRRLCRYTLPLQWIGLRRQDLISLELDEQVHLPLSEADKADLAILRKEYAGNEEMTGELDHMVERGKVELQALYSRGIAFAPKFVARRALRALRVRE
jgi:Topoisomerase 6 subunit A/Spo11, Toprim domain